MTSRPIITVLLVSFIVSSCASARTGLPTPTTLPTAVTAISTDPIAGEWLGNVQGYSDNSSTPILVTIDKNCGTGSVCGTYSVPSLPCSGNLLLTSTEEAAFVFAEQPTGGAAGCGSGGFETMQLLRDNSLSWESGGPDENINSKGILTKVARDGETVRLSTATISRDNLSQLTELAIWGRGAIKALQWSQDGSQVIVDTSLGRMIYDSVSFQLLEEAPIPPAAGPALTFEVEPLGSTIDSRGGMRNQFRIHVFAEGRSPVGSFDTENIYQPRVRYHPESNLISIDNMMGGVGLRDGTTYEVIGSIGGSWESPVTATPDHETVAAGTMDGSIIIKSGDGLVNEAVLEAGGPVRFLSFSPDGTRLVSETNGIISTWDVAGAVKTGSLPDTFLAGDFFYDPTHRGTDATVRLAVKENRIAYVNKNMVILRSLLDGNPGGMIDGKEGTRLDETYQYEGGYMEVDAVFFAGDNQSLVTVNYDRAYVWDLPTGQFIKMISQEKLSRGFMGLVSTYSAGQDLLLTGSQSGNFIKNWTVADGVQGKSLRAWDVGGLQYGYDGTHSLTISPDGRYVFSWSGLDGAANLWELETQEKVMSLKIPRSEYSQYQPGFYPVALSPDNTRLAFSYSLKPASHITTVYSVPDGTELYRILNYYAVFSPDGSMIAASLGNNQIRFYDSQTGQALGTVTGLYPNPEGFQLLYFSEDGKSLIAVSTNGTISMWGVPS